MIVDAFLEWTACAPVERRVEAADALARAYLYSPVTDEQRRTLTTGLFTLVDDSAVRVRERLADVFANRGDAPRPVVFRLLDDVPSVCATLFARSPLLLDRHLLDGLSRDEPRLAMAIAERMVLCGRVVDALVDRSNLHACLTLLSNPYVRLSAGQIDRYITRFGNDAEALQRLLDYRQVTTDQRCRLVVARREALAEHDLVRAVVPQRRLERISRAAQDQALLNALEDGSVDDLLAGLQGLYREGLLSQAFLLRAVLGGHMTVLEGLVAVLADTPVRRVRSAFVHDRPGVSAALLKKARLSPDVSMVVSMSIVLARELARADVDWTPAIFAETLIEVVDQRVSQADETWPQESLLADDLVALCHSITADICQDEARSAGKRVWAAAKRAEVMDELLASGDAEIVDLDADIGRALAA
ncbi:MAG: DUF2336 domain-containing protein [Cohaesibacteraceae bacterium]